MDKEFEVSVTNTFETETAEQAVALFIEWIIDNAPFTGYRVVTEEGTTLYIDGDDLEEI